MSDTSIAVADPEAGASALAHILGTGDLSQLTNEQRVGHYLDVCTSLSLNPRTRPFDWIEFYDPATKAKKLQLYPNRSCAEQLRRQHQISVRVVRREMAGDLFCVEVEGTTPNGRRGTASKYVSTIDAGGNRLRGNQLANAYMKAETGALRRLTFSMVGMASPPDPDELARVRVVTVDGEGRIVDEPTDEQKALARDPGMAAALGEPTFETAARARSPFSGMPDQRVRPDEITPTRPSSLAPRPSFKPTDEQIDGWRREWFAVVKGLSLDDDEERHRFIEQWTNGRTRSLRNFFASATEYQANDLLGHVRALMEDEKRSLLESAESRPEDEAEEEAF